MRVDTLFANAPCASKIIAGKAGDFVTTCVQKKRPPRGGALMPSCQGLWMPGATGTIPETCTSRTLPH
jgi:hypothetical protein